MKIPINFYLRYWTLNSFFAFTTGFLIVFLIPPLFSSYPYLGLAGIILYQIIAIRLFWGDLRGDFEYNYRKSLAEKALREIIINEFGVFTFFRYFMDKFNQIGNFQGDIANQLLKLKIQDRDNDLKFLIYLKIAEAAKKDNDYEKEREVLDKAQNLKPEDLIVNYKLAVSYECFGIAEKAIHYYQKALNDPSIYSKQLKIFIKSQIERIKEKGPRKKPPMLGLRYVTW